MVHLANTHTTERGQDSMMGHLHIKRRRARKHNVSVDCVLSSLSPVPFAMKLLSNSKASRNNQVVKGKANASEPCNVNANESFTR
eukprot:4421981-Amphidinium_carterae.1